MSISPTLNKATAIESTDIVSLEKVRWIFDVLEPIVHSVRPIIGRVRFLDVDDEELRCVLVLFRHFFEGTSLVPERRSRITPKD